MQARRVGWYLVAGALALTGTVGAAVGALSWDREVQRQAREERTRTVADVSGRATETIRRAVDLSLSFRGVISSSMQVTPAEFARWIDIFDPYRRHPGLLGFGYLERTDPLPLGPLPATCPLRLGSSRSGDSPWLGANFCTDAIGLRPSLARATDSGVLAIGVLPTGEQELKRPLLIGAAVYDGELPTTVLERRHRIKGWVGVLFDGDRLIGRSLAGHPGLWIQISHHVAGEDTEVLGSSGGRPPGAAVVEREVHDADGRWLIKIATPPASGVSARTQAVVIFVAGSVVSLLLALLLLVLSRSRDRALRLVATKTDELQHQALHDPLTGLPNRALIMDRVEGMLARCREDDRPCAVMFIDLDDFKDINDTVGHGAGDILLQAVAGRLAAALRPGDTVGRLGGDEFVVLLEGDGLRDGAEAVAERLLATLADPYGIDGLHPLHVQASIGIATGIRETAGDLLRDADVALYGAKGAGRNQVVLFEPSMQVRVQERLDLETALRAAEENDELFLVYQPTFDLDGMEVSGVEALIRWNHPDRGVLYPDTFIPLAEQTGLIVPMGRWVLHEACRQAASWLADGHPLGVSVNVSARQLDTDGLLLDVAEALAETQLPPSMLTLEVTESAIMADTAATVTRIRSLKELGVRVAIDDFGTGYSSLAYLQQFPVDQLKIDRSFIAAMGTSPEATTLIRTLVQLGRALGIETLAEGIEDPAQRDHLQAEHCGFGQGYLFARPLAPEDIVPFLHKWETSAVVSSER